jgi:hypothetical protein
MHDGDGKVLSPPASAGGAFPASWFNNDADRASESGYEALRVLDGSRSFNRSQLVSPRNEPERNAEQGNESKGKAATDPSDGRPHKNEAPLQGPSATDKYDAVCLLYSILECEHAARMT